MEKEEKNIDKENKNKGGRPPVWATPEELSMDIEHYELFCEKNPDEVPDIESFCYFIIKQRNRETLDRETLRNYEAKPSFSALIKKVKIFMAYKKKQKAYEGKIPPAIFCFDFKNNHDYVEHQKVEHSNDPANPLPPINIYIPDNKRDS